MTIPNLLDYSTGLVWNFRWTEDETGWRKPANIALTEAEARLMLPGEDMPPPFSLPWSDLSCTRKNLFLGFGAAADDTGIVTLPPYVSPAFQRFALYAAALEFPTPIFLPEPLVAAKACLTADDVAFLCPTSAQKSAVYAKWSAQYWTMWNQHTLWTPSDSILRVITEDGSLVALIAFLGSQGTQPHKAQ